MPILSNTRSMGSVILFQRPPRRPGPAMPGGELELQEPPVLPDPQSSLSNMLMYAPTAMGSMAMLLIFIRPQAGPLMFIAMGLMGFSAVAMIVMQFFRNSMDRKRKL